MKKVVLLFSVVVVLSHCYTFQDYVLEFKKEYSTPEEYSFRERIFQVNYAGIQEQNTEAKENLYGVTDFTDRSDGELAATLSTNMSEPEVQALAESPDDLMLGAGELPSSVRWQSTPVRQQLSCGSCWAFATVGLVETIYLSKTKLEVDLAEQALLECTKQGNTCSGGNLVAPIVRVLSSGVPEEKDFPYLNRAGMYNQSVICNANGLRLGQDSKYRVIYNVNETTLKTLLAQGPLTTAMYASRSLTQYRSDKVWSCTGGTSWSQLNHAVLLVGYDEEGNYIIKNSWGDKWGDKGYVRINPKASCGIGSYSVLVEQSGTPSFQTTVKPSLKTELGASVINSGSGIVVQLLAFLLAVAVSVI